MTNQEIIVDQDLFQNILIETVRLECPENLNFLDGLWTSLVLNKAPLKPGSPSSSALGAIGSSNEHQEIVNYINIMITFWGSLPNHHNIPSESNLYEGLRAAGLIWGLQGQALENAVSLCGSRFIELMSKHLDSEVSKLPSTPSTNYWKLSWSDGLLQQPELLGEMPSDANGLKADADLLINETSGICLGTQGSLMISELKPREQVGLWLALMHTGKEFTTNDIQSVLDSKIDDSSLRQYVTSARIACNKLVGRDIIPTGKKKRYRVPGESWSWVWILKNDSPHLSILVPNYL